MWHNKDKWSEFPKSTLVTSEIKERKDVKGLLNSTGESFW